MGVVTTAITDEDNSYSVHCHVQVLQVLAAVTTANMRGTSWWAMNTAKLT
jgi:hypothetical protein